MHLDVTQLRNFYYRTALGRAAQGIIRGELVKLWPEAKSQTVIGFGFAVPLLRPFLTDARRVIGLMPAQQGVAPWPLGLPNVSVMSAEDAWPLETGVADKIVVLHGLEVSDEPGALLDEVHRVLGPGGRAVFIVPNRVGLWARRETTPFGFGRPYTLPQLETQVTQHGFLAEKHAAVLFQPPSNRAFWLKSGRALERMGRWVPSYLAAGVLMLEVTKRVQAPLQGGIRRRVRRPLEIIEGIGRPEPALSGGSGSHQISIPPDTSIR